VKKKSDVQLSSLATEIHQNALDAEKLRDVIARLNQLIQGLSFNFKSQRKAIAEARRLKAIALYSIGTHPEQAVLNASRAYLGFKRNGGTLFKQSLSINSIGMILWSWKGFGPSKAVEWFEKAALLARRSKSADIFWKIETSENLGLCYFADSKSQEGLKQQELALKLLNQITRSELIVTKEFVRRRILRRIANIQQEAGNFKAAAKTLQQARAPANANADEKVLWYNTSGILAQKDSSILSAEIHFDHAVSYISQSEQNINLVAAVFSNTALLKFRLNKLNEAEDLLDQMAHHVSNTSPLSARLGFFRIKARFEEWQGNWNKAYQKWHKARKLVEQEASGDPFQRSELIRCEAASLRKGSTSTEADQLLDVELMRVKKSNSLGLPLYAVGYVADLIRFASNQKSNLDFNSLLAEAFAVEIFRGDLNQEAELFAACAKLAVKHENDQAAILFGKLWLTIATDEERTTGLNKNLTSAYNKQFSQDADLLISKLVDNGRYLEAGMVHQIQSSEQFREFVFRHSISRTGNIGLPFNRQEAAFLEQWQNLRQQAKVIGPRKKIKAEGYERNTLQISAKDLVKNMFHFNDNEIYNAIVSQTDSENWKTRYSRLSIRYTASDAGLVIEAKKGLEYFSQLQPVSRVALNQVIASFRDICGTADGSDKKIGRELYDLLFANVLQKFPECLKIDLYLSGALASIPFAALFDGKKYISETCQISICTETATKLRRNSNIFYAFGAPVDNLPAVNREMIDISDHVSEAQIVSGSNFTKHALIAVLSNKPSYLHFSGHFDLVPGHIEKSYLTIGDGTRLSLLEIMEDQYDFRGVKCIVLSGCNTAVNNSDLDGFQSLARLLICKGARSVIGSLWKVHDGHSADFMKVFYENFYLDKKWRNPAYALQKAQAGLANYQKVKDINSTRNLGLGAEPPLTPYAWCGFVHYQAI